MADHDRQVLAELARHPGWQLLIAKARETKDAYYRQLAATLYHNPEKLSESDLHYKRGYFDGMALLLNHPLLELKQVERELARTRKDDS